MSGKFMGLAAVVILFARSALAAEADTNIAVQLQDAFTQVAESAFPAVVVITNKRVERRPMYPQLPPEFHHFFGVPRTPQEPREDDSGDKVPQPAGRGSGVIIRDTGFIVTNHHVIQDSDALEVKLWDGRVFDSAIDKDAVEVFGSDAETDLAVIRIGGGKLKDLPALEFADSTKTKIGEWAIAVGAPFNLDYSVTVGVVSQKGRYDMNMNTYENYIQTDASINPGNSGGPLLNIRGQVIGISDFIVTGGGMSRGSVGIGFAIASDLVSQIAEDLIENREVIRPWLGIAMQGLDDDLKKQFDVESGVLISEVMENDPADKAGLKPGDVILKVGDKEVRTPHDVQFAVLSYKPGDEIPVHIDRNGEKKTVQVTARRKDGKDSTTVVSRDIPDDLLRDLGLTLQEADGNVTVAHVVPGSAAAAARLMQGDTVLEVNRQAVKTVAAVVKALGESRHNMAVFYVDRRGSKFFVPIHLGDEEE